MVKISSLKKNVIDEKFASSNKDEGRKQTFVVLYFILFLPFVEPYLFKTPGFEIVDSVYAYLKLIAAIVVFVFYSRYKPCTIVKLMIALQGWILLATVINNGSLARYAGPAITAVFTLMLAQMAFADDAKSFLRYIRDLLSVYIVIHVISQVAIENGWWSFSYPFLGIDNRWVYCLLPWVTLTFVVSFVQYHRFSKWCWVVYAIALLEVVSAWSVGALLALGVWPIVWLWQILRRKIVAKHSITNPIIVLVVVLIINFLLVDNVLLPLFGDFIKHILGKDVTLAGRIYLWATVFDVLNSSPFFGAGVQPEAYDISFFFTSSGNVEGCAVNHPHNQFLNIAYHGGYIALLLYIGVLFAAMNRLNKISKQEIAVPILCSFVCFFVASFVDTLDYSLMYILLYLPFINQDYSAIRNFAEGEEKCIHESSSLGAQ